MSPFRAAVSITIRLGKGGRGRVIPIGQATTEALLRYLGEREHHPRAAECELCGWAVAASGSAAKDSRAHCGRRAQRAGVEGFRLHRLRHTAAPGGSPTVAPSPASWPSPAGPAPTCSSATPAPRAFERAADEARRLNLGAI